jgi:biotin carboxyl carrier protein
MNYCVSIGEREYRIKVLNDRLEVDGQNVDGDLIPLNTGGLHMLRRGARDLELHLREQDPGLFEVLIGAQRVMARVESQLRRTKRRGDAAHAGALSAPMPGLVTGVQVGEGEEVEKGQVLILLESMKMQMQMRAPIAGRVSKVTVQRGAQVEKGTLLVQVD